MNVLFVTAEAYPFKKVGGLGDVSYALPKALNSLGIKVNIIMPKYRCEKNLKKKLKQIARFKTFIGWKTVECILWSGEYNGITYYFVDNPFYFFREEVYGHEDDNERYIFFSKAVLEALKYIEDFSVDIIHCNDWHSALIIPLKNIYYSHVKYYTNIRTVFTIHNLCYQGLYNKEVFWMLGLEVDKYFIDDKFKLGSNVSFMKWGIAEADKITAVSKQYGKEIQTIKYGCGLENLLKRRSKDLIGIENGIDLEVFNPETDKLIYENYSYKTINKKGINKQKLKKELGFVENNQPLIGIVSRLVDQKGIDLIEASIEEMMGIGVQVIILGSGNVEYEEALKYMASKYEENLRVIIKYDESLAHKIYAASDYLLMPSKFEPCGLAQLIAMRYGTIPIVRRVGGLIDTVKDFNRYTLKGNGLTFERYHVEELIRIIKRAILLYNDKELKKVVVKNCMEYNSSWEKAALQYKKVYESVINSNNQI